MNKIRILSFENYLELVGVNDILGFDINIFRGQDDKYSLLPTIARINQCNDTTNIEKDMIDDLSRRSQLLISRPLANYWERLVFAQHFGLKTRLLDWTSNPLAALWFACSNFNKINTTGYVYSLMCEKNMLLDTTKNESPFENDKTRVLRPSLNNERIIAQSGWFTAHKYSNKHKKFIALEKNAELKKLITEYEISGKFKKEFLKRLSIYGINNSTLYPDISGLCKHLNWQYDLLD